MKCQFKVRILGHIYAVFKIDNRSLDNLNRWISSFYDFRYKKNIKALYIVHPTMFIKTLLILFKPIIRYVPSSAATWEIYCTCNLNGPLRPNFVFVH